MLKKLNQEQKDSEESADEIVWEPPFNPGDATPIIETGIEKPENLPDPGAKR